MLTCTYILQRATIITSKACGALAHSDAVHGSSFDLNVWSKCFVGRFASCAAIFQNFAEFFLVALQNCSPVLYIFLEIYSAVDWPAGIPGTVPVGWCLMWASGFYFISFRFTLPQSWQASPSLADWPVCTASRRIPHSVLDSFTAMEKHNSSFLVFTKGQCCCLCLSPRLNISTTFHGTFTHDRWNLAACSNFRKFEPTSWELCFLFWRLPALLPPPPFLL